MLEASSYSLRRCVTMRTAHGLEVVGGRLFKVRNFDAWRYAGL